MKKRLVVFLTMVLCVVFAFAGCGSKNDNEANGNNKNTNATDNDKDSKGNEEKSNETNNSSKDTAKDDTQSEFEKQITVLVGERPEANPPAAMNRKDTLIVAWGSAEGNFIPIYSSSTNDGNVCDLIFGTGLVGNDAQGLPVPEMAERWEISEDGRTYTFYMKKGIKFQNGEEVTAEDVAFTYTAICDPNYDGSRMDAVSDFVGYDEYKNGDATSVEGIKVIDKYTISFTLTNPKAPAIYDFGYAPMSKSYYGFEKGEWEKCKELQDAPMGAGPFKLVGHNPGQDATFERFDDYYKGTPKLKKIVFKVVTQEVEIQELVSGGLDICAVAAKPSNIDQLKDAGFLNMHLYPGNAYSYIGLNLRNEVLSDKNVRQAMMYGLNRQGFVDAYYKGYGATQNSPLSQVCWAHTEDLNKYEFNPEKAKELLEASGWKVGDDGFRYKDGQKLTFSWKTSTDSAFNELLAKVMVDNYKDIGLELVPELMEFATLCNQVYEEQDFEVYSMSWGLSIDPDPRGIFGEDQLQLGGFNSVGWDDPRSFELMDKGLKETEQAKRVEIYKEWAKLANEELPYLFLSNRKSLVVLNDRIKNVKLSPYKAWISQVENIDFK